MDDLVTRLRAFVACDGGDLADIEEAANKYEKAMQLLDDVMASPEYLTDSYYRELGKKFKERYKELCANR